MEKKIKENTIDSLGKEAEIDLMIAALRAKLNSEATINNAPRAIF